MSKKLVFTKITNTNYSNNSLLKETSGINTIISNNSNISIKNNNIFTNNINSIFLNNKNKLQIISSNISGSIISNNNNFISNQAKYDIQHIVTNQSNNSIYNFPSVNFEYNRSRMNLNLNTTLFSGVPYISKPILLSGDTPVFGSFNDSILLGDTQIEISGLLERSDIAKISVLNYNNEVITNNYIETDVQTFFSKLPYNLNGHTLTINLNNFSYSYTDPCKIKNIIGGKLILNIKTSINFSIQFINCKNIYINSNNNDNNINNINNISGVLIFNDCKHIYINNICFNYFLTSNKPEWAQNNTANIYIKNSDVIIQKCNLNKSDYGIAAYNSKIYLIDTEFNNNKKYAILYNFSTIDSNKKIHNLQDYIDQIQSGQDISSNRIDGLYKHFHPQYIPTPDLVPNGAVIGFPRIVNGLTYCEKYDKNLPSGIIATKSMENILPSCFIPFDSPCDYIDSWKTEYQLKLNELSGTVYKDLSTLIQPFDSSTYCNSYSLLLNTKKNFYENTNNINNELSSLSAEYISDINILTDIQLTATPGITYDIITGLNNNGLICNIYNITKTTTNKYNFSGKLNLLDIKEFYINNNISDTNFKKLALEKSYISITIDNNRYDIPFKYINRLGNDDNNKTIAKIFNKKLNANGIIIQPSNGFNNLDLSAVPIRFQRSITNIKVYYFGVPLDRNCSQIIGMGQDNTATQTIKQFNWINKNNENIIITQKFIPTNNEILQLGNLKAKIKLPKCPAYYQFYADTILCFYINKLDNKVNTNNTNILKTIKTNLFTNRIFRRVEDAIRSSINYLYILPSTYTQISTQEPNTTAYGLYRKIDEKNTWQLLNQYKYKTSQYNDYKIISGSNSYTLSSINDSQLCTFNNIGTSATGHDNNNYTLYSSKGYNNLLGLSSYIPSTVLDIADTYQQPPSTYMQTNTLYGKSYGYIPAMGYNFDFSRKSINSMVSGYFRIRQKNKQFIYTTENNNRIITGKIDGFQTNLNILYESLNNLRTYISYPLFKYTKNNISYNIYPFDTQSLLSTTPYYLNSSLILSNILFSTIDRVVDVMRYKHSTIITDNITNTKNDILFSSMYPTNFISDQLTGRYETYKRNYTYNLSPDRMDSYGMYWPLTNFNDSNLHTCIPFIKETDYNINRTFIINYNNSTSAQIPAYPFGYIQSTSSSIWYLDLSGRPKIEIQHCYNKLPLIYKLPDSVSNIKYTGYIKIPINATLLSTIINNNNFNDISAIQNNLSNNRNKIILKYKNNGKTEYSVFYIPKNDDANIRKVELDTDIKFSPKYKVYYAFDDIISFNANEYSQFKQAYNNVIIYAGLKLRYIWYNILDNCKNQASFISYSTLFNNDVFIFGMQNNRPNNDQIDFNDLKTIPDYTSGVFSIYNTIKYFNTDNIYNQTIFDNYALSTLLSTSFNGEN